MRTDHHDPRDKDVLTDLGYETKDVNISGVRFVAIAWTALLLFAMTSVGLWYWLAGPGSHTPPGVDAGRVTPGNTNPNNPILQTNVSTKTDIMTIRHEEDKVLEQNGSGHIPIEQAMDLVASGKYISTGNFVPARTPQANVNPSGTGGAPNR